MFVAVYTLLLGGASLCFCASADDNPALKLKFELVGKGFLCITGVFLYVMSDLPDDNEIGFDVGYIIFVWWCVYVFIKYWKLLSEQRVIQELFYQRRNELVDEWQRLAQMSMWSFCVPLMAMIYQAL